MGSVVMHPVGLMGAVNLPVAAGDREPSRPNSVEAVRLVDTNKTLSSEEVRPMSAAGRPNSDQWSRLKQRLRTELGEDVFTSWFARVEFEEAERNIVYLSVPTRFLKS